MSPLPDERVEEVQASAATGTIQPEDVVISGMSGTYANCHNVKELSQKLYAKAADWRRAICRAAVGPSGNDHYKNMCPCKRGLKHSRSGAGATSGLRAKCTR
ncbi:hypothetical protein EVAR_96873_1 [Eumeta japonica]|uniref:Uncharacterized protein n=1 Tax=Eumeta variegata TaxID=151549 RepID=A0A4C1WNW0_EUMVA|nr:hypothetical protein EVAR_96873_1 [Eumeta japonica]